MKQRSHRFGIHWSWHALLLGLAYFGCSGLRSFPASPLLEASEQEAFTTNPGTVPDSVTVVAGAQYRQGRIYSLFLGKQHRQVWATPVRARVLQLQKEKGGLQIEKIGGSMQTTSITLTDPEGVPYVLRSLDKDPVRGLPALLRFPPLSWFLRDQTTALNPYAALVVASLAAAGAVPQTSPELVYLPPSDPALGKYKAEAGDKVYLLERKLTERKALTPALHPAIDIVSTKQMLRSRYENGAHVIDQRAFARARLFDILINDRDRHEGQWNWAVYPEKGQTVYRPIPKDRDQALYTFEHGLLPKLVGQGLNHPKYSAFHDDYRNLRALTLKSKLLDEQALPDVSLEEFVAQARELQRLLTDEVIERAVRRFPKPIFALEGESTIQKLKSRRDLLPEAARAYYLLLAKEVLIAGTDQEEHFEVKHLDDEQTEVTVRGAGSRVLYHRVFNRSETKEILLYGLGGSDVFEISGQKPKGINLVLVTEASGDSVSDRSKVEGRKRTVIRTEDKYKFKYRPKPKNQPVARKEGHASSARAPETGLTASFILCVPLPCQSHGLVMPGAGNLFEQTTAPVRNGRNTE